MMNFRNFLLILLVSNTYAAGPPNPSATGNNTLVSPPKAAADESLNQAVYDVLNRMDQLQLEVRKLRGQLEEQSYAIEQVKKRQNGLYTDIEQRLQLLEGSDPALDKVSEQTESSLQQQAESSDIKNPANEKRDYQAAYEKLRNGHYQQAIDKFQQITLDYPQGTYADNAQYWLAETYIVNQDTASAQNAFIKVMENYPDSPKVPDAMLKLGYIEAEKQNWSAARKYLTNIVKKYPETTAAHLAGEKLAQMNRDKR